jgi:hypothetical protein
MVEQIADMVAIVGVAAVLLACMITQFGLNAVVVERRNVNVEKERWLLCPHHHFSGGV